MPDNKSATGTNKSKPAKMNKNLGVNEAEFAKYVNKSKAGEDGLKQTDGMPKDKSGDNLSTLSQSPPLLLEAQDTSQKNLTLDPPDVY